MYPGISISRPRDVKRELIGDRPEHLDERDQQDRGLQQADRKIGGQLGEVARILVHALIGIHADRSRVCEPGSTAG
jgi:hypothetical protein